MVGSSASIGRIDVEVDGADGGVKALKPGNLSPAVEPAHLPKVDGDGGTSDGAVDDGNDAS